MCVFGKYLYTNNKMNKINVLNLQCEKVFLIILMSYILFKIRTNTVVQLSLTIIDSTSVSVITLKTLIFIEEY